jgi:hypothetical protein
MEEQQEQVNEKVDVSASLESNEEVRPFYMNTLVPYEERMRLISSRVDEIYNEEEFEYQDRLQLINRVAISYLLFRERKKRGDQDVVEKKRTKEEYFADIETLIHPEELKYIESKIHLRVDAHGKQVMKDVLLYFFRISTLDNAELDRFLDDFKTFYEYKG